MNQPNHASVCAAKIMAQDLLEFLTLASRSMGRDNPVESTSLVRDAINKLDETARMLGYEVRQRKSLAQIRQEAAE